MRYLTSGSLPDDSTYFMAASNFACRKPDMLNLRTAESTVTLTEKPQGVDYSRVRDLTLPEYFSLSEDENAPFMEVKNEKPLVYTDVNIGDLLNHIDIKFCDAYDTWLRIGAALFNSGFEKSVFDVFSERSHKYSYMLIVISGLSSRKNHWNAFNSQP